MSPSFPFASRSAPSSSRPAFPRPPRGPRRRSRRAAAADPQARGRARARARAAAAATRAARDEGTYSARIAADALHPSVWLSTTPGYSTGLPVVVAGSVPAYGAIEVRQTIYDPWKKNDALQAEAREAQLEGALVSGCSETVRSAVLAYARAWTDERRAEAARKGLAAAEASVDARGLALRRGPRHRDRGRAGEAPGGAGEAEALERRVRPRPRRARAEAADRLAGQRAFALYERHRVGAAAGGSATDNLEAARSADPQLKSLGRQVDLLGNSASLSSKRWPVIEASAQYHRLPSYYSKYYNSFNENDFSFGITFAIPVWAGGRIDDTEARARASVMRAEAERDARETGPRSRGAPRRGRGRAGRSRAQPLAARPGHRRAGSCGGRGPRAGGPRRGGPPRRQAHAGLPTPTRTRRRPRSPRSRSGSSSWRCGESSRGRCSARSLLARRGAADALGLRSRSRRGPGTPAWRRRPDFSPAATSSARRKSPRSGRTLRV